MRADRLKQICVLLFFVAAPLHHIRAGATDRQKQLEVKLRIVEQDNCAARSSSVPVVYLKLRMEIKNLTDIRLIVSKDIGKAWYGIVVAKDDRALADGSYESDLNIDWAVTKFNAQNPPTGAPPAEFVLLGPGKSFFTESTVTLPVQLDHVSSSTNGQLQPGNHVLQLDLGTWLHVPAPETFKESWKKYGELAYAPTKSNPLQVRIPPATDFATCKN
jgi:hypothetical protein